MNRITTNITLHKCLFCSFRCATLIMTLCMNCPNSCVTICWYCPINAHSAVVTAELGRALAVVKVTLQVNGNSQFLSVHPPKTTGAIKIKSGTNDYVGEGNPHAKFGNNPITGGFSPSQCSTLVRTLL